MLRQYAPVAATAIKSPAMTSPGNQVSRHDDVPASQCLPTMRESTAVAEDSRLATVQVYARHRAPYPIERRRMLSS